MAVDARSAYAAALADKLDQTAAWRREKAEQFPDDRRNGRCAAALTAAAEYLRSGRGNRKLVGAIMLWDELDSWRGIEAPEEVISEDVSGRFFFDNGTREPAEDDFDELITAMFRETLASWRESIESGIDQPPGSLVRLFDEWDVPLWEHDGKAEAMIAAQEELTREKLGEILHDQAVSGLAKAVEFLHGAYEVEETEHSVSFVLQQDDRAYKVTALVAVDVTEFEDISDTWFED
jgi:hypothetical protein